MGGGTLSSSEHHHQTLIPGSVLPGKHCSHYQPQPLDGKLCEVSLLTLPAPDPWTGAPCSPQAYMGRESRGEARSKIFHLLRESVRRSTLIRPMYAWGEHGAPVQGLGLVVRGGFRYTNSRPGLGLVVRVEFRYTNSRPGVRAGSAGWVSLHEFPSRGLGLVVRVEFRYTNSRPGVRAGSAGGVSFHNLLSWLQARTSCRRKREPMRLPESWLSWCQVPDSSMRPFSRM